MRKMKDMTPMARVKKPVKLRVSSLETKWFWNPHYALNRSLPKLALKAGVSRPAAASLPAGA